MNKKLRSECKVLILIDYERFSPDELNTIIQTGISQLPEDERQSARIDFSIDHDNEPAESKIVLRLYWERLETDNECDKRMAREEVNRKLMAEAREKMLAQEKQMAAELEERDRALYERLKAKFEGK